MGLTDAQQPGESGNHDAALTLLDLKPLADDATPDQFSIRIDDAITNHIPYLKRKFANDVEKGLWVATARKTCR